MSRSGSPESSTDGGSRRAPSPREPGRRPSGGESRGVAGAPYGVYVVVFAAILLIAFTVHVALSSHKGTTGIRPGTRIPPFAAPYAIGGPPGEVDIATHANDGLAGKVPACSERGPGILNVCQLYERGPLVLALFFQAGSCPDVLDELRRLAPAFPQVGFAAVGVKEPASSVARLVRSKGLTFPVGADGEGRLGQLYAMVSCPQVTFVYPGGLVQSASLLSTPTPATLRARVAELLAASRAHGWKPGRV
ncbi:MAG TPA: hypothetical protein VNX67_03020 [Solirubrobacteraceae bacterium]|jgi:hypothetical protein|nr:hypothetical protein [Solirubrobacteraceae bacterium]